MKTLEEIPIIVREAYCAHEVFRRLGYPSENIFMVIGTLENKTVAQVLLKHDGKEFGYAVGDTDLSEKELSEKWLEFCDSLHNGEISDYVLNKMWRVSHAHLNSFDLCIALQNKGISFPFDGPKLN